MTAFVAFDASTAVLEGTTLIEASAGTGKTHTIATLFVRLLLERPLDVGQILVVTYTRAATAELRQRIRARVADALDLFTGLAQREQGGAHATASVDPVLLDLAQQAQTRGTLVDDRQRLQHAIRSFDQAAIFTIHGFCQRVLAVSAFETGNGFDTQLLEDQRALLTEVVQDYYARTLYAANETLADHLRRKVALSGLQGLAQRVSADLDALVTPQPQGLALPPALAAFEAARVSVGALFQMHENEIRAQLTVPERLNRTTYTAQKMADWWPALQRLSLCDFAHLPKCLDKLTPPALLKGTLTRMKEQPPRHAFFDACAQLVAARDALGEALDDALLSFQHGLVDYARRELQRRKLQQSALAFDDLLQRLRAALRGPSAPALLDRVRQLYPAALIDEFQDTDLVQSEIFERIYDNNAAPGCALFLIGDPKQAIYGFRGADVFAYMRAARRPSTRSYTLAVNWRSDPGVVRAVNTLFSGARAPFLFPEIRFHEATAREGASAALGGCLAGAPALELCFVPKTHAAGDKKLSKSFGNDGLCELVADELVANLNGGVTLREAEREVALEPRHIAVLCRSNQQARTLQQALRQRGVPTVLEGDDSVFDSETAGELNRVLWAMAEPGDGRRLRAALTTSLLGHDGAYLLQLDVSLAIGDEWLARFHRVHELWETRGFIQALHVLLDELCVAARLLSLPDGERRLTDLLHLSELLHAQAMSARLGPLSLIDWYQRMRGDTVARVGTAESAQIRLESDARAVTLTTIHKSKGLEYPWVYCPFMWDGALLRGLDDKLLRFHDRDNADRMTLELSARAAGSKQHRAQAEREALAENLRLLYVALTRAKHRVSVVWGDFKDVGNSALGYLLHQANTDDDDARAALTCARIEALDDAQMLAELHALAAASAGAIGVKLLGQEARTSYEAKVSTAQTLHARAARRQLRALLRSSSFSQLSAAASSLASPELDEGLDRDQAQQEPELTPPAQVAADRIVLASFPAGVTPGHLIHEIYETIDFRQSGRQALAPQVGSLVARYGLPGTLTDTLSAAIAASLDTALDPEHGLPKLGVLAPQDCLRELEFVFPVAPGAVHSRWLRASALGSVLHEHATTPAQRQYAQRVAQLGFAPLAGYLRGFIDLVARWDGRYYLLDYKSNHLGEFAADYHPERLAVVMGRHHYVLQYLLYVVALHRYLALRVAGYDYDTHFGGVYYLFVRGMAPGHALSTGVFRDRPSRALIEGLGALLDGAAGTKDAAGAP